MGNNIILFFFVIKYKNMVMTLLLLGLGAPEILFIALIILLLFGGKKIPELMKGLGKGVKSFKAGLNDLEKDINSETDTKEEKKE